MTSSVFWPLSRRRVNPGSCEYVRSSVTDRSMPFGYSGLIGVSRTVPQKSDLVVFGHDQASESGNWQVGIYPPPADCRRSPAGIVISSPFVTLPAFHGCCIFAKNYRRRYENPKRKGRIHRFRGGARLLICRKVPDGDTLRRGEIDFVLGLYHPSGRSKLRVNFDACFFLWCHRQNSPTRPNCRQLGQDTASERPASCPHVRLPSPNTLNSLSIGCSRRMSQSARLLTGGLRVGSLLAFHLDDQSFQQI